MKTSGSIARRRRLALLLWLAALQGTAFCDTRVAGENLELAFDSAGNIAQARSCIPGCDETGARIRSFDGAGPVFSAGGPTREPYRLVRSRGADATRLVFESASGTRRLTWTVPDHGWLLRLEMVGLDSARLASGPAFRPLPAAGFGPWLERTRYVSITDEGVAIAELDDEPGPTLPAGSWSGFRNRFWAALVRTQPGRALAHASGPGRKDAEAVWRFDRRTGQAVDLYLGPVEPAALRSASPELYDLMYASLWLPLRWICRALFLLLQAIHAAVSHWAVAIMLLSVAVSLLMRPLSKIADRLQDDVHRTEGRLAPQMQEIRRNYRGEEQAARILDLYKREGVHPLYSLKSLAGVAVVLPIFIGAFDMLAENIWLSGESFLWISDLSRPDAVARLPLPVLFLGDRLNVLPFLMTGLSVWASWLHQHEALSAAQQRQQVQKLSLMAVAFFVLFYTFPSGMVLYWTTNNLISVARNLYNRYRASPTDSPDTQ